MVLTVLEAGGFKIKVLVDSILDEGLLLGSYMAILLCLPMAEGAGEISGVLFIRVLFPFMEAPPEGPTSKVSYWGSGFNKGILGGHKYSGLWHMP